MKRRSYILLVLTIIVLATVFFMKRPQQVVETSYALPDWQLPVDTSRVVRIGIQRGSGSMMIDRKHGTWRHKLGDASEVDGAMVTHLLEGIADFRLLGLVSSNPRKQDVFEVGEAGTSVVVTTDDGKELSLVVGKMSSLPSRSYIRPAASDMVFLASGLTPDIFNDKSLGGFRQRTFNLDSTLLLSFSIATHQTSLTIRRQGKSWLAGQNPIPHEEVAPMLVALQEIRAEEMPEEVVRRDEKPFLSLDIQEQKRVKYDFYSNLLNDNGYVLKASSSLQTYHVGNETIQPFMRLINVMQALQPVTSNVQTEPEKKPLPSEPKVSSPPQSTVSTSRPQRAAKAGSSRQTALPKNDLTSRQDVASMEPTSEPQKAVPKKTIETSAANNNTEEDVLIVHKVKPGESLESIAQTYNITREQLKQWNLLTADFVQPGTELYVFVRR